MGNCAGCHTPREGRLSERLNHDDAFAGQSTMIGEYAGAINAERLALYSAEAFVNGVMAEGMRLDGLPMTSATMRRVARATGGLSHEDRVAIYAYLMGAPVDPSTVQQLDSGAEALVVEVAQVVEQAAPEVMDMTGATSLMNRVDAFCAVPDEAVTPAAAVPAAASPVGVSPEIEAAVSAVLDEHCRSCHGPGMTYQRSFLTGPMAQLARDPAAVVSGDHQASLLYDTIASNRMPTPNRPRLQPAELQALVAWIDALAPAPSVPQAAAPAVEAARTAVARPAMPELVGGSFEEMVGAAVADLGAIDEQDRQHIRYFSFAHLPMPEIDCTQEGALRNPMHYIHAGLNKFINSVFRAPTIQQVTPVARTDGALVRIDLRDFGWTADDWRALTERVHTQGAVEAGVTAAAWDELAPPYPYAVSPTSDPMLGVIANYTGSAVPILQADWFTRHASEQPYYDMLLRLPDNIAVLEARMGIDVFREIREMRLIRAGFLAASSGVSDHNRMLERFDLPRGGYYWRSYDFAGSDGSQSLITHPDGPAEMGLTVSGTAPFEHDGGEMIFSLPNGMQGYYLSEADGRRLSEGPTSIVSFRERPIGRGIELVNGRSCFACHDNGMIARRDEIRSFIQTAPHFDIRQRDVLLRMYPEQSVLDEYFRRDTETFVAALSAMNATQRTVAGREASILAPDGSGEIVTWLADFRFRRLDIADLAQRFFLTEEEFRTRARQIGDPHLAQLVSGWVQRFDNGLLVTQDEVDTHWAALLPRLTLLDALDYHPGTVDYQVAGGAYEAAAVAAIEIAVGADADAYAPRVDVPAYVAPVTHADPLEITLHVPRQQVYVDDLLTFEVSTNRACILQIIYVEINDAIVELPQAVIGAELIQPDERRLIPQAASGLQLRFDRPGVGETLLAYCREPSSGQPAIDAAQMVAVAHERYQPLFRGLTVEAANRVEDDAGRSAFASVTIDVLG
ncbi:cytochrome c [Rhodobacteraceae bacterium N5(2021)]|uniref:Cytochrome c n=1 Tax=Gymnodinialimonas phycosphaerae TaxID=2841589 RepID=A0ABS7MPH1_9RHOB|nr:cytochrome c [Gymnodinialimonas phycosphaerae]MBY4892019.1 cytochrome c [Gymnodinialimonas phycosphaerae]